MKRKAKREKVRQLYLELYGVRFVGLLGWDQARANRFLLDQYGISEAINSDGFTCMYEHDRDRAKHIVIYMREFKRTSPIFGLLAHEAFHAAAFAFSAIGETKFGNDEAFAYLLQWVFQGMLEVEET